MVFLYLKAGVSRRSHFNLVQFLKSVFYVKMLYTIHNFEPMNTHKAEKNTPSLLQRFEGRESIVTQLSFKIPSSVVCS